MKKGTKVSFSWTSQDATATPHSGTGVVISDEEDGHVLVAIDPEPPEVRHFVIWCTVTWLTTTEPQV